MESIFTEISQKAVFGEVLSLGRFDPSKIRSYLGKVQLPPRASCTDDEVFREKKTLSLTLFLQRQGAQTATGDLPFLTHGYLDK